MIRRTLASPGRPRAAILLECILSLAILVGAGLAIISLVDRAGSALTGARDAELAADLARSTMSKLAAGLGTVQTLAGPVESWRDERDETFDDSLPADSPWTVAIDAEPAEFPGLTLITVTAINADPSGRVRSMYSLRQLVALGSEAGESDGRSVRGGDQ